MATKRTPNTITRAYIRHYRDNGQTSAYVEWSDGSRTEGRVGKCSCCGRGEAEDLGTHMQSLFDRAQRDGLTIERETW